MSLHSNPTCETLRSREQVLEEVKRIVAEFAAMPAGEIRESHLLLEELGLDSLDLVECTMEVEEEFGILISDELGEKVKSVGDIADGVAELLAKSQAAS